MKNRKELENILGMEISQKSDWDAVKNRLAELDPSLKAYPGMNNFFQRKQFRAADAEYKNFYEKIATPVDNRYRIWAEAQKREQYFYDPIRADIEKINLIRKLIPLVQKWDGKVYNRRFYAAIAETVGARGEGRTICWFSTTLNRAEWLKVDLWCYGDDYTTQEEHRRPRINSKVIVDHLLAEIEWAGERAQRKINTLKCLLRIGEISKDIDAKVAEVRHFDLEAAAEMVDVSYLLRRFA
jgi:hypothetical protein